MSFGCVFLIKLTLHRNPDAAETPAFRPESSGRCQRDYHQKRVDILDTERGGKIQILNKALYFLIQSVINSNTWPLKICTNPKKQKTKPLHWNGLNWCTDFIFVCLIWIKASALIHEQIHFLELPMWCLLINKVIPFTMWIIHILACLEETLYNWHAFQVVLLFTKNVLKD